MIEYFQKVKMATIAVASLRDAMGKTVVPDFLAVPLLV